MTRFRLLAAGASIFVLLVPAAILGALTPEYNALAEPVSRLASSGQPYAAIARASFVLYGIVLGVGVGALIRYVDEQRVVFGALVACYGVSAVVAGLAPKDLPDTPHTVASQIHVDATIIGGVAIIAAMLIVARHHVERTDRLVALVVAMLVVAGAVVYRFTWGTALYGLVERVVLALGAGWVSFVSLRLLARRSALLNTSI